MALIKCPECGREISDKAEACPGCACPMSAEPDYVGGRVQTIEKTSKEWKTGQLVGGGFIIVGLLSLSSGAAEGCVVFCLLGVAIIIGCKTAAWWYHG